MQPDTSIEAESLRLAALRRLSGPDRLAQALEMSEAIREIAEMGRRTRLESQAASSRSVGKGEAS